jgi:succinate dehydrogenase / fumarate reductase flavoprotein subunit
MKVAPAVHYSMGGLWVDYKQMTNIPGLFAAGECEYQFHGANRLGANALVACVHGGWVSGLTAYGWATDNAKNPLSQKAQDAAVEALKSRIQGISSRSGNENLYVIRRELGQWMNKNVTIVRYNKDLETTAAKLVELGARLQRAPLPDQGPWTNQPLVHAIEIENMLDLARAITAGAIAREESRGAHYKPDKPKRDDQNWLRTTKATYTPNGPKLDFSETIDTSLLKPVERRYDVLPAHAPKPGGAAAGAAAH